MTTVRVAFYSSKRYDIDSFNRQLHGRNDDVKLSFTFLDARLSVATAPLAQGHDAVCIFVNDDGTAEVLQALKGLGIKIVTLRCAGFNNVDLQKAAELGIAVARVPAYSPDAVAEFAVGMILTVIRKYHKTYNRVREGNFLLDGLLGSNIHGSTVGVIGTGKIGLIAGRILSRGFGARVIAFDPYPDKKGAEENGITYVTLDELLAQSDIITLHCPLTPSTQHIINEESIGKMKSGVVIVNTSRGGLIETKGLIKRLKEGKIKAVGMDVYERECDYFFQDGSGEIMQDDRLARLLSFNNVFISGHQAFLTTEALAAIASTTIGNLVSLGEGKECVNICKL